MSLKLRLAIVLLLLAGLAQLIHLAASNGREGVARIGMAQAAQSHPAQPDTLALPLDKPVAVDLSADAAMLMDLSPREREDQQRDWLLLSAAASLGLSTDTYARIFFDLPSTRQSYMRPVASFEYGKTRSRLVQPGVVLALLPAGVSEQQRRDDLAHIADLQRKNQGDAFERLMVVEYTLDSGTGRASLTLRKDVSYQRVFSEEYGYVERDISDRKGLEAFMAEVDDLSLMRKTPGGLLLGGRKSQAGTRRNIGVEEVATVWQSEQSVQRNMLRFDEYLNAQEREYEGKWGHRTFRTESERAALTQEAKRDAQVAQARIDDYRRINKVVPASGFSLDPAADYPRMAQKFEEFAEEALPAFDPAVTAATMRNVASALKERDMGPYEKLKRHSNSRVVRMWLTQLQDRYAYQEARYDGELQGTEVGMVLFYTDLLAKLWTIDFAHTSPSHGLMPVFLDDPAALRNLSPVYMAETDKLSSARLWFGHTDQGYQLARAGDTVLLASNVTRIFSAGSNPEDPGKEVQTSAFLAASIDWWNDHYEEVAVLEPQYQRLNQIMKWSVLLAWLNNSGGSDKLQFLADVKVRRDHTFGGWTGRHPELRFAKWGGIGLRPPGTNGATESMPRLHGEVTAGGVSLASKQDLKLMAPADDLAPLLRRSNLRGTSSAEGVVLKAADDTAFHFRNGVGEAVVSVVPKSGVRMRAQSAEFANAEIEHAFKVSGGNVELQSKISGKPLESLHIQRTGNGFSVGLHASDMAQAHRLANLAAKDASPHRLLADPMVESLIQIGDDGSYAVKLRDTGIWVRLDQEPPGLDALAAGWLLRAAPRDEAARIVRAKLMKGPELLAELPAKVHLVVRSDREGRVFLHAVAAAPPAVTHGAVETGNGVLKTSIDPAKSIHLTSETSWHESTLDLARRLGAAQMDAMRKGGQLVLPPDQSRASPLIAAMKNKNYRDAAASIAVDPASAKSALVTALAEEIKRNVRVRTTLGLEDALHHIDESLSVYGPQPELLVRKGLLQIERGNLEAAAQIASSRKAGRPLSERSGLYDEINARVDGAVKENLWRYAQFIDHADTHGARGKGFMRPVVDSNHFDFDFVFHGQPAGTPVANAAGIPDGAKVYWQASEGLNGVDWSGSLNSAMGHIIQGKLGKILHLTEDGIADYRPAAVWLPDGHGGEVKLSAVPGGTVRGAALGLRCNGDANPSDSSCRPTPDTKAPRDVYLVTAN